jgi:hypothetical protein
MISYVLLVVASERAIQRQPSAASGDHEDDSDNSDFSDRRSFLQDRLKDSVSAKIATDRVRRRARLHHYKDDRELQTLISRATRNFKAFMCCEYPLASQPEEKALARQAWVDACSSLNMERDYSPDIGDVVSCLYLQKPFITFVLL